MTNVQGHWWGIDWTSQIVLLDADNWYFSSKDLLTDMNCFLLRLIDISRLSWIIWVFNFGRISLFKECNVAKWYFEYSNEKSKATGKLFSCIVVGGFFLFVFVYCWSRTPNSMSAAICFIVLDVPFPMLCSQT